MRVSITSGARESSRDLFRERYLEKGAQTGGFFPPGHGALQAGEGTERLHFQFTASDTCCKRKKRRLRKRAPSLLRRGIKSGAGEANVGSSKSSGKRNQSCSKGTAGFVLQQPQLGVTSLLRSSGWGWSREAAPELWAPCQQSRATAAVETRSWWALDREKKVFRCPVTEPGSPHCVCWLGTSSRAFLGHNLGGFQLLHPGSGSGNRNGAEQQLGCP